MRNFRFLAAFVGPLLAAAQEPGSLALVVYNAKMPGSKDVAAHYAEARQVPPGQVVGFDLPTTEQMTRAEFHDKLAEPLRQKLRETPARYVVVCYGVPLRVAEDPTLQEPGEEKMPPAMRRNGAAVDAEITLLPSEGKFVLAGPVENPFYGTTNLAAVRGVLLVGRLDGPTASVARALVDKALEAETNGLWGRAYFDLRGITNGEYKLGDDEIRQAANVTRQFGFDTITDDQPGTFARDFPMSQIALYAGWYDSQATGPFTLSKVEFMPGAFAYHLYSYSANTLRGTNESWCETLLAKGVTATMGCVDEPFLDGTPDMGIFFARWLQGATFGEAAFLSERALSWQTTVLGDPLYRPFGKAPRAQHEALLAAQNPLVAWSFVRIVNVEGELGTPNLDSIKFLEKEPWTARSAVLSEKLGDLCRKGNYRPAAVNAYKQALKLHPTPLQRARLESAIVEAKKKRAP